MEFDAAGTHNRLVGLCRDALNEEHGDLTAENKIFQEISPLLQNQPALRALQKEDTKAVEQRSRWSSVPSARVVMEPNYIGLNCGKGIGLPNYDLSDIDVTHAIGVKKESRKDHPTFFSLTDK